MLLEKVLQLPHSRMPHVHTLCCAHRPCVSAQVSNSSCRQTSLGINDLETLLYRVGDLRGGNRRLF